ncbi:MAG: YfiR family protein [Terracidiphilus sp.]
MIHFLLDGSRVRFEVNLTNAQDAGLNLSSELLKVAVRVTKKPHAGN